MPGAAPQKIALTSIPGGFGSDMAEREASFREPAYEEAPEESPASEPVRPAEPVARQPKEVTPVQKTAPQRTYNISLSAPWFSMELNANDWYVDDNCVVLRGASNINLKPGVTDLEITLPNNEMYLVTLIGRGKSGGVGDEFWIFSIEEVP